jgi:hypothetical protein
LSFSASFVAPPFIWSGPTFVGDFVSRVVEDGVLPRWTLPFTLSDDGLGLIELPVPGFAFKGLLNLVRFIVFHLTY